MLPYLTVALFDCRVSATVQWGRGAAMLPVGHLARAAVLHTNRTRREWRALPLQKNNGSANAAVSKNISQVLENLLKNYESSQLPTHGKGIMANCGDYACKL